MMAKLTKEQLDRGVICSSAGNHAQGVALAAKILGCDAVIAMPVTTPEIKVHLVQCQIYGCIEKYGFLIEPWISSFCSDNLSRSWAPQLFLRGMPMMRHKHMPKKGQSRKAVPSYLLLITRMSSWGRELLGWKLCVK